MKKLTALVLAAAVAATSAQADVKNIPVGKVQSETLALTIAGTLVALTFIGNNTGRTLPDTPPQMIEKCAEGDALEAGLCYKKDGSTKVVVVATGTGTGTSTTTITVPVVTTYKPDIVPKP